MKRAAFMSTALLCCLALSTAAFAQSKKAASKKPTTTDTTTTTTPAPPSPELAKARMRPPVKGTAYIEIIKTPSKKVGNDIVTVTKVKNVSEAPIAGLRIDEWWYAGKEQVSAGSFRLRQPLAPGEIADLTTNSPWKPGLTGSNLQFTHANGTVKPTSVKSFTDDTKKKKK
jgi:hypothetical protein